MAISDYNPFAKRSEFSKTNLMAFKILTILTWLVVVVFGAYYNFNVPTDCHSKARCRTIWGQNARFHTGFSLNKVVTDIYWILTLILQVNYLRYLWSSDTSYVSSAANVGSHYIFNNLLVFGFIMLWVRGFLWIAELLLIINFFNLTSLYFRHPKTPMFVHIPIVSAPYAWNLIAILWTGAAAVHATSLAARIFANIFIWVILVVGGFFLVAFRDWNMGFELSILSLSLALAQFARKIIALQWIFAFVVFAVLFVASLGIAAPGLFKKDGEQTGAVGEDREREPLLDDQS